MNELDKFEAALQEFIVSCVSPKDTHGYAYATGYIQSIAAGFAHELLNQGKDISGHTKQLQTATNYVNEGKR